MTNSLLELATVTPDRVAPAVSPPPVVSPVDTNQPKLPPMYAVLLHNDRSTLPSYVVQLLEEVFNIETQQAERLMMTAHNSGTAVIRIYGKDLAETKLKATQDWITSHPGGCGFGPDLPCELTFSIQPESDGDK